jgi:hypothetical protein
VSDVAERRPLRVEHAPPLGLERPDAEALEEADEAPSHVARPSWRPRADGADAERGGGRPDGPAIRQDDDIERASNPR